MALQSHSVDELKICNCSVDETKYTAELATGLAPIDRWLDSSVGRALHLYCRGYGFKSASSLIFFFFFSGFNFTAALKALLCVKL